jgi:hypothetical protein
MAPRQDLVGDLRRKGHETLFWCLAEREDLVEDRIPRV